MARHMDRPTIAVIGGGYAGLTAAARMGEARVDARVVLIDAKDGFVERIRLHEVAAGGSPRALPYRPFLEARGVEFVQAHVVGLDPGLRQLRFVRADGVSEDLVYDQLVYALGSHTDLSIVPGAADHALALDSLDAAAGIARRLADGARRVLVVGGGLTGIEAAAEIAERLPATAVAIAMGRTVGAERSPGGLAPEATAHIRQTFDRMGVQVVAGARVARLDAGRATLGDGRAVAFDLCLWAAGFRPPPLARDAGLSVNAHDRIVTDATLRSVSHPDVVAIGDAAEVTAEPGGACRMSCAAGRPMGEAAAKAVAALLAGGTPDAFGFGYTFRCVSLGRADGLIQFVDPADRPAAEIWTGARAARWKEYICRRTLQGVGLDPDLGPPPDEPPAARTALSVA